MDNCQYKQRCGTSWKNWYVMTDVVGQNNPLTLQSYQGSKSLSRYWFKVSFYYFEDGIYKKVSSLADMYSPYHTGVKFGY
jgi:hypothetical protein